LALKTVEYSYYPFFYFTLLFPSPIDEYRIIHRIHKLALRKAI
jgi:hypothetical protein